VQKIWQQATALFEQARNHQGFRKYGKNTVWLFAEKAVRMLVGFTVGIYVARQLGPEQYGMLNYAINFVSIFGVLVSLGMDFILVRELVNKTQSEDTVLGTAGVLRLAAYGLMLIGLACSVWLAKDDQTTQLLITIIALGYSCQIFQGLEAYFQANVLIRYVVLSQLGALLVVAAGRFYFAWGHFPLYTFAALESLLFLLTLIGMCIFYHKTGHRIRNWKFDRNYAIKLWKDSWILLVSSIVIILCMRVDQIIIKQMLGDEAVGNYVVMNRLVELWYFIPITICTSMFPSIIGVREFSIERYRKRLFLLYALMVWSGIAVFLGYCFFGRWLVHLLYGVKYAVAGDLIGWYASMAIIIFFGVVRGKWLATERLQKYNLIDSVIWLFMIVGLNILLISYYGLKGSVFAGIIANFTCALLVPTFFKRSRESTKTFLMVLNPRKIFAVIRQR